MERNDMIVAVVGVVILIIALAGILYHEKTYAYPEETQAQDESENNEI